MPTSKRTNPNIPDHEVLRKIGGGAYGEVWMARAVTGALRAVKVVFREDFSDERTFEREFEGILKFEPISRDHPGLVHILHVGRSPDATSFYYYVMELGDDTHTGQEINPVEYEARTLRADGTTGVRLDTDLCIEVGLSLSEALAHLHSCGLAHRDVKPSNVIFVNGKAKLADIGLVAARGQRTFVGTEGFVPPEGPGSAQADVYSLGKVLYEIATGKDRLDFPELPDELPGGLERKRWLELNRIICEICEPRISKRTIDHADKLADALRSLRRGKRRPRRRQSIYATTLILLGFTAWASWEHLKTSPLLPWHQPTPPADIIAEGQYRIGTSPEGAEVYDGEGELIATTTTRTFTAPVGTKLSYIIRKNGYRQLRIEDTVTADSITEPMLIFRRLQNFTPPISGEKWEDHLGTTYLPLGEEHISSGYVNSRIWQDFLRTTKRNPKSSETLEISENGKPSEIILASRPDIIAFTDWLRVGGIRGGFLTQDNQIIAKIEDPFEHPRLSRKARREKLRPFRIIVREYAYGAIQLTSQPRGADVYVNGLGVGNTASPPLLIPKVKPGPIELLLILEGYKPLTLKAQVNSGQNLPLTAILQENQGVIFGKSWENGIGMKFEPIGPDLMASAWETRVRDYDIFVEETKAKRPRQPGFPQSPDHPVIYVSRNDATAFCKWLTQREREAERISLTHTYRLPTDLEWSRMAGLDFEVGDGPIQRDANKPSLHPWGTGWPPPEKFANYADSSAAPLSDTEPDRLIPDYQDGFPRTAPVASFEPNSYGLFDISGNIQEWISDDISSSTDSPLGVVRGGGWNSYLEENLLIGWRNPVPSGFHGSYYGFRIVLSKTDPTPDTP